MDLYIICLAYNRNRFCERITHWQLDSPNTNTVIGELILKALHLLWLRSGFRTGRPGCGRSLSWWCVVSEAPWLLMRTPALRTQNIASVTWPRPGSLDTRSLLVNTGHVTRILDCDWLRPPLVTVAPAHSRPRQLRRKAGSWLTNQKTARTIGGQSEGGTDAQTHWTENRALVWRSLPKTWWRIFE